MSIRMTWQGRTLPVEVPPGALSPAFRENCVSRSHLRAYAVCGAMFFSALVVFAWHLTIPRGHRVFHQIGMVILVTAGIAYFALGSAVSLGRPQTLGNANRLARAYSGRS